MSNPRYNSGNYHNTKSDGTYYYTNSQNPNSNGSYYYQNANGSTYYNNPNTGTARYTTPSGRVVDKSYNNGNKNGNY
ncbi:hypothetical protein BGZ94_009348 [Podila epigama]|nr:hypothetical protein BGZ94_009348 [Podila epigama]